MEKKGNKHCCSLQKSQQSDKAPFDWHIGCALDWSLSKADVSPFSPRSFTATYQCLRLRLISSSLRLHCLPPTPKPPPRLFASLIGLTFVPPHLPLSARQHKRLLRVLLGQKKTSVAWKRCCAWHSESYHSIWQELQQVKGLKQPLHFAVRCDLRCEKSANTFACRWYLRRLLLK